MVENAAHKKDLEKKVVKYDNLLNQEYRLNQLTGSEQDLFFAIVAEFNKANKDRTPENPILGIEIPEKDIKKYAGLSTASTNVNYEKLKEMMNHIKMFTLTTLFNMKGYKRNPENNQLVFDEKGNPISGVFTEAVFTSFFEGDKKKDIVIRMNPNAAMMFYHFNCGNFTQFFLDHHTKLKWASSKIIYRLLLNGKNALRGFWNPSQEEIYQFLGIKNARKFKQFREYLPAYLKDIRKTGDFLSISDAEWHKGKYGKIIGLTITYKLNPHRMKTIKKITLFEQIQSGQVKQVYERKITSTDKGLVIQKEPMHCSCGGKIYEYTNEEGLQQYVCENSAFWKLGKGNCKEKTAKLPLENKWNDTIDQETIIKETTDDFRKPTIEEVKDYGESWKKEKNLNKQIDYSAFVDYYEAVGWKQNGTPIVNWQPLLRNWIRRQKKDAKPDSVNEEEKRKNNKELLEAQGIAVY